MLAGAGAMVEMIYHLQLNAANGPELPFAGWVLNTQSAVTWGISLGLFLLGLAVFEMVRKQFARQWSDIQTHIAALQQPRQVA